MSLPQSVRRSFLCSGCRTHLVRSFFSAAGLSLPAAPQSQPWQRNTRLIPSANAFSSRSALAEQNDDHQSALSQQKEEDVYGEHSPEVETALDDELSATRSSVPSPANETPVPWYLQVDPPIAPQQHVLSERQRLPDLPPHAPDLLQPILQHVSVDLGIDDLSLLDLRALDPPPALGANLIMVIGTARSEKHLHVSADRLCRWLRSNHSLSPFADGLLGRNELKLKLRRKAKRSRLLSAVGAKETASGDVDDGIRTGWVCVNVGKVDGGLLPEQQEAAAQDIENFIGFGTPSTGCRIVVQMMTEEKRGEIDLETLWNGILRRSKQKNQDQSQQIQTEEKPAHDISLEAAPQASPSYPSSSPVAKASPSLSTEGTEVYRPPQPMPFARKFNKGPLLHQRAFHTFNKPSSPILSELDSTGALHSEYLTTRDTISDNIPTNRQQQAILTLRDLLSNLKAMDRDVAIAALGKGRRDTTTTPFLRAFYSAMPNFPDANHWHMHVELRCYAVCIGHSHYTTKSIMSELEAMRLACITPTEETYMMVLEALLAPLLSINPKAHEPTSHKRYKKTASLALDVLDNMHEDGYNPVSDPVLRLLYQTTALPPLPSYSSMQSSQQMSECGEQQAQRPAPLILADLLPTLSAYKLATTATTDSWSTTCTIWRSYPQQFHSRSHHLYAAYLKSAAKTNSQSIAMDTLRASVPDMSREEPAVKFEGEVAHAVKECLLVAEPNAQELGEKGSRGEWAVLWRRLMRSKGGA